MVFLNKLIRFWIDVTPHDQFISWNSDEYSPLKVFWYKSIDFTDYDEILEEKEIALKQSQIFGLHLNCIYFNYLTIIKLLI